MRLFSFIALLSVATLATPAIACDLDGIYGNRFSAFSGAHNPPKFPTVDETGLPVSQQNRVPARISAAKSDLEVQPDEVQPPVAQPQSADLNTATKDNKLAIKSALAVKR